jgi:DNA-3-methyladenine glycosylase
MILPKKFYQQNTLKVAQDLLGCFLMRKSAGQRREKIIKGIITETEAYMGEDDLASHASKGRTPRTEIMYGEAGRAYVYMIYGMYHCLNIVTEKKDFPAAVLIRGLANVSEWKADKREWVEIKSAPKLNGPGKLCKFLKIDKKLNNHDMTKKDVLWIERGIKIKKSHIEKSKRIGIDYAKHCKEYLWRFHANL